jgi:hypothetical protein
VHSASGQTRNTPRLTASPASTELSEPLKESNATRTFIAITFCLYYLATFEIIIISLFISHASLPRGISDFWLLYQKLSLRVKKLHSVIGVAQLRKAAPSGVAQG